MKTNPNDYANPISVSEAVIDPGLTKLEHFAGLAMQGLINFAFTHGVPHDVIAEKSVLLAKALITQLNKEQ